MTRTGSKHSTSGLAECCNRNRSRLPANGDAKTRHSVDATVTLVPLDSLTLRMQSAEKLQAVAKDASVSGMGVVNNIGLSRDLYLAAGLPNESICLLRKVRHRNLKGNVAEYGFEILDRFGCVEELVGTR